MRSPMLPKEVVPLDGWNADRDAKEYLTGKTVATGVASFRAYASSTKLRRVR